MKTYNFTNDHDSRMNCFGTEEEISNFIESNWDTDFSDVEDIDNVSSLMESDIQNAEYLNLSEKRIKLLELRVWDKRIEKQRLETDVITRQK